MSIYSKEDLSRINCITLELYKLAEFIPYVKNEDNNWEDEEPVRIQITIIGDQNKGNKSYALPSEGYNDEIILTLENLERDLEKGFHSLVKGEDDNA